MIAIPEFSENQDKAVLLYFSMEGSDEAALRRSVESTYVCVNRMGVMQKNGKKYLVAAIDEE